MQVEAEAPRGDESAVAQHRSDQLVAQRFRPVRTDRDGSLAAGLGEDAVRFVRIGEVVVGDDGQAGFERSDTRW